MVRWNWDQFVVILRQKRRLFRLCLPDCVQLWSFQFRFYFLWLLLNFFCSNSILLKKPWCNFQIPWCKTIQIAKRIKALSHWEMKWAFEIWYPSWIFCCEVPGPFRLTCFCSTYQATFASQIHIYFLWNFVQKLQKKTLTDENCRNFVMLHWRSLILGLFRSYISSSEDEIICQRFCQKHGSFLKYLSTTFR